VEGTSYNFTEDKENINLADTLSESGGNDTNAVLFERALNRTVEEIMGMNRNIVIISQVPEIGYDVPSAYFIAQRTGRNVNEIIAPSLAEYLQRNNNTNRILGQISAKYNIQIIEPWKVLCNESQCLTVVDNRVLYMDAYHLSIFGSEYISHIYDSLFEKIANNGK
jgi:hypothetical protein